MRQSLGTILLALLLAAGCDRPGPAPAAGGIICITPAGTDLLAAMGLTDRIVGVSPYEANDSLRGKLPKVGDYLRIDWEKVAELKPAYLVIQGKRYRLPAGTSEKCTELGIKPIILQIDRLDDIEAAVLQLGRELDQTSAAARAVAEMEKRINVLKQASPKPVPAMIAFGDNGVQMVGRKTFIDDALVLAGGENVIEADNYVTIDLEKLATLKPAAVFMVLPDADAATVERAKAALLAGLPNKPAVFPITSRDALLPGTAVLHLAETMAADLRAVP